MVKRDDDSKANASQSFYRSGKVISLTIAGLTLVGVLMFFVAKHFTKEKLLDVVENNTSSISNTFFKRGHISNSGMYNKGNTCFFNSSIQALLSLPKFVQFFTENQFDSKTQPLCAEMQNFIFQYKNTDRIDPQELINVLSKKINLFNGRQQDSNEFLTVLIDKLNRESECSFPGQNSIDNMFRFCNKETRKCIDCNFIREQLTFSTSEFLHDSDNVQSYFDNISKPKIDMSDDAVVICGGCQKNLNYSLFHNIESTSDYLMIYLDRFSNCNERNDRSVFPNEKIEINKESYELISAIYQSGSLNSGHYWSYCKRNHVWYEFNDSSVAETTNPKGGKEVYTLIYSKIKNRAINTVE